MLVDSKPVTLVKQAENMRYIGSLYKKKTYSRYLSVGGVMVNRYKDKTDIAIRNFVKGLVSTPPLYNLPPNVFLTNIEVVKFVKGYKPSVSLGVERVSLYKTRDVELGKITRTKESDDFVSYVKQRFPMFDTESFYLSTR